MDVASVQRTAINKKTGEQVSEDHPAFFHSYEYLRGHKLGIIKLNPVVAERMTKDSVRDTLHPRHLPMLVKPKPWLDHNQGGYIYNKSMFCSPRLTATSVLIFLICPKPVQCASRNRVSSRCT
jgi:DNA-directed RNA polymerase, mitochondrial